MNLHKTVKLSVSTSIDSTVIIQYDSLCTVLLLTSRWYYVPTSCDPALLCTHIEKAKCIHSSVWHPDLVAQSGFAKKHKYNSTHLVQEIPACMSNKLRL